MLHCNWDILKCELMLSFAIFFWTLWLAISMWMALWTSQRYIDSHSHMKYILFKVTYWSELQMWGYTKTWNDIIITSKYYLYEPLILFNHTAVFRGVGQGVHAPPPLPNWKFCMARQKERREGRRKGENK